MEETGGLKAQIAALMQASVDTQAEARRLSSALRRGAGVQGRWGEQMLRNVLEAQPRLAALMASRPALARLLACVEPISGCTYLFEPPFWNVEFP